ncbi:MAG: helix-turn-helix transcriptional regulator [Gammaproteobacteria bacterium]|uniref:helix-turn-helix transcriptional regulator n=1 Tax=Pseudomaricurvus alcaniphilus TaxID=1166482 RepID=UPI00140D9CAA|nr:helix-turn-helix transcriptional regulator [Pseudomaricurvus alcaniphilus]MBR9912980.1 helix-turn-helix transcriptional regulator [Gammaproteobacteria bacterium]NHN36462.1 helix-turn-helix transcriptional regulator [Pseudomaricurvus alcaniphilus]
MKKDLSIAEYSTLLGYLYSGHIEEDPYSKFLDLLRDIMECNFASMTLREPIGDDGGLLFISSEMLQKTFADDHNPYTDQFYTSNLMTNLQWGEVQTLDQCTSYSSLESTDLYKICMQPINIYHMLGVDLRNANGQRFSVRLCRPKEASNFSESEKEFFQQLGSHIQRAVASGMQLIQLDSERKLFAKTISGRSIGTITLDEHGKIINCNLAADEMIRSKDGIGILNEHIYPQNNSARERLNSYIKEVITAQRKQEPPPMHAMVVERLSGKASYELLIKPISVEKTVESTKTPHIMVFISDPEKKHDIDIKMLMSLYYLTPAEASLAKNLAAGYSLDQSAANLGIARNTARAQLRSIFSKTGVTQQSMLVSLILKSLATFS